MTVIEGIHEHKTDSTEFTGLLRLAEVYYRYVRRGKEHEGGDIVRAHN